MYDGAANVCHAVYDGRPTKSGWRSTPGWRHGRGGRKWQRWWRRWRAATEANRRVHQFIDRFYSARGRSFEGLRWQVLRYDSAEVREHLFVVRLGGEGRFGSEWRTYIQHDWNTLNGNGRVREANGEGNDFRIIAVGRFRKRHPCCRCRRREDSDVIKRRFYDDPYYRWTQRQLQDEGHHN